MRCSHVVRRTRPPSPRGELRDASASCRGPPAGPPRLLRTINERALLDHLRRVGPPSRAQLARDTGLSKPTVSLALANLERAGLARAVGQPSRRPAAAPPSSTSPTRPPATWSGIDIGRDWVRVAAADLAGAIVARTRRAQSRPQRRRRSSARSAALAHEVVAEAGLTWARVAHTVVGSPASSTPRPARSSTRRTCPAWRSRGVMDELRDALPPSITIENDANLAALGERDVRRGPRRATFVYVAVGTGLGMGIVIDGELYRGAHGVAGEVAYVPIPGDGPAPHARARGIAGGGGVGRRGGARPRRRWACAAP